jgi:hypothetical protein
MIVVPIDQRHVQVGVGKFGGSREPAETSPDDDDSWASLGSNARHDLASDNRSFPRLSAARELGLSNSVPLSLSWSIGISRLNYGE